MRSFICFERLIMANGMEQGIMALEGAMPQSSGIDPSQFSPVIESYARSNPKEFNQDLLSGMAEADPAVVNEFVQALSQMRLPQEVIDALQLMVDNLLADPANYAENRAILIQEGVPEDMLPMEFDAAYFAAFNIALDKLDQNNAADMEQMPAFAQGGIVSALKALPREKTGLGIDAKNLTAKEMADYLASLGRGGDSVLAHITPAEARMLRSKGGSGTINPKTGLVEYGIFSSIGKAIGKVVKSVTKVVKSVVKTVTNVVKKIASSTIGKIALTAGAVFLMGPAGLNVAGNLGVTSNVLANAVNTFAGSTVVNLASGQKIGDAIKSGVISGAVAGAATGLWDATFGKPQAPAPVIEQSGATTANLATKGVVTPSTAGYEAISGAGYGNVGDVITTPLKVSAVPTGTNLLGLVDDVAAPTTFSMPTSGSIASKYLGANAPADLFSQGVSAGTVASAAPAAATGIGGSASSLWQQGKDLVSSGWNMISPSGIKAAAVPAAQQTAISTYNSAIASGATPELAASFARDAYNAAMPGVIGTYGPLAAVGLGGAALMGAFTPPKTAMPQNAEMFETTGSELLSQDPSQYGLTYGGTKTTYAANPYKSFATPGAVNYTAISDPYANIYEAGRQGIAAIPTRYPTVNELLPAQLRTQRLAKGGEAYPRKTGHINGPGTGTSDSVPAMLSDGEFVFTAKAVRAMGNGSRRKGAKRMYALMKQLERKAS